MHLRIDPSSIPNAQALVQHLRKNRRAAIPQVAENVNAGREQTVSAAKGCRQLHKGGYQGRVLVQKPLVTKNV